MRRVLLACFGLLLFATSPLHAQTPPPAFQVTAGANLKELVFDWDAVPGAVIYKLLWKTRPDQYFEPYNDARLRTTRVAIPLAVHQMDWQWTRFVVLACNTEGCTRSNEIAASDHMLDAIGYFKASNGDPQDHFGAALAMSADGGTLAVAAPDEDAVQTGANINESNNGGSSTGAVYIYRRSGRQWAKEAYLKHAYPQSGYYFGGTGVAPLRGRTLSLSADGSVLAVGAPSRSIAGPATHEGTVYTFTRNADRTWNPAVSLTPPSSFANDFFGYLVDLSSDGRTLMVSSVGARDGAGNPLGHAHIFTRPADTWQHSVTLPPVHGGDRCPVSRMSANGRVLVSACNSDDPPVMRAVTRRLVNGAWVHVGDTPINWRGPQPMAINYDGTRLAINFSFMGEGDFGVGIFHWEQNAFVLKAAFADPRSGGTVSATWGWALEFDRSGRFLAVGDPGCKAQGAGVSPFFSNGTARQGCVHVYENIGPQAPSDSGWRLRNYVKAPNPAVDDQFGSSIAMGDNGWYLAIGAPNEDSSARGIDGDQSNDSVADSGAVYLY